MQPTDPTLPLAPRILHADVDAMFVQCAVLQWPELADEELVLVGGSPDARGVVASCSYGARRRGVHSAMPMATALRLCPDAVRVPVPGPMVKRKSREVREALLRWGAALEQASVDEFYLDVGGISPGEPFPDLARRMQAAVRDETSIVMSFGGGTNRLVAKMATRHGKPAGVFVVPPGEEYAFLGRHELTDIPGVGPALYESLRARGAGTIGSVRMLDRDTLALWLGPARADWLYERVRGIAPAVVEEDAGPPKSVSAEETFARDLFDDAHLVRALRPLVADVGHALRRRRLRARTITVKVRDADRRDRSRGCTLPEPIESNRVIYETAQHLLLHLRGQRRGGVRLLGVTLSNLEPLDAERQLSLLDELAPLETEADRERSREYDLRRFAARRDG